MEGTANQPPIVGNLYQGYQPPQGSLRKKPDRRKPAKHNQPPPAPSKSPPEEEEPVQASKRARKPPSWLQTAFDDLPALVAGQEQQPEDQQHGQQQDQEAGKQGRPPTKGGKGQASKPINWRLLDVENMVVEIDHEGHRYRGVLERTGASPNVGIVQEDYQPSTAPTTSASIKESRELCALCNQSLMQHQAGVEEDLQKVVRVQLSSMWLAYVHLSCGLWAPEVFEDHEGNLESDYLIYCPTHASKRDRRRHL
ncbi:hypothetical protein DUNSADRAFT_9335 [Dunaliella salina]|uniref:Uncharacterized protein n=1 Tax=Dunaliella salina TaxID=3046 RepID=A0ABQ7H5F1_DUNSA|nr:hypothetical protein DUNSADRAFT_9335 [Dunaliella salina]|eukprot:KAF5842076.1 hypothetical protein DUNSADRAFT_9335 [Dunaliella salina]